MLGIPHRPQASVPLRIWLCQIRGAQKRSILAVVWESLRAVGLRQESARRPLTWCLGWLTPASQPAPPWTPSIPCATPTPTTSAGAGGGENFQSPHTPTVSLRSRELHLPWPLAWQICWSPHIEPTLPPPRAIADHPLPPSLLGHLADRLPPPSLSLCSPLSLGRPWSLPTPLAPQLPILCFLLSHSPSLSFLPLSAALFRSLKPPLSITQWTGLRYCRHLSPRPFLGQEVWAQEEGVDGDLGEAFVPMLESRCVVT